MTVVGPVAVGERHRSDGVVTCALVRLRPEEHPECRETRTEMLSILMGRGGPRAMGVSVGDSEWDSCLTDLLP